MRAISDHARGEDFGTKADGALTATRVPQEDSSTRVGTGSNGPSANLYRGVRLLRDSCREKLPVRSESDRASGGAWRGARVQGRSQVTIASEPDSNAEPGHRALDGN